MGMLDISNFPIINVWKDLHMDLLLNKSDYFYVVMIIVQVCNVFINFLEIH